jgi:porphobilinogen synthase
MFVTPPALLMHRPRRNRKSNAVRAMMEETHLHSSDLIYPLFIVEGEKLRIPVVSMPQTNRYSLDQAIKEIEVAVKLGIPAFALFPVIHESLKCPNGSEAINPQGLLARAISAIKREFPDICLIADVALDPYTTHGHDGLINAEGIVQNDATVEVLVKMALTQAEAGIDMVAPSDMMDGRVKAIRIALDAGGFSDISIHAYSAKYASAFYGPFRDALSSHTKIGNKKHYQLNPANCREALREGALDEAEGADILMVKPALPYLDIIAKIKEMTHLPVSAYQVSGEYAMIMAASQKGWIDGDNVLWESLISIKRAGADMIFTYAATQVASWIKAGKY